MYIPYQTKDNAALIRLAINNFLQNPPYKLTDKEKEGLKALSDYITLKLK